jgi:hypothetical protein
VLFVARDLGNSLAGITEMQLASAGPVLPISGCGPNFCE